MSVAKIFSKVALHASLLMMLATDSQAQDHVLPLPIEVLADSMEQVPRPILVLISTDWCSYCQWQKVQLTKRKDLKEMLQQTYYLELNAESRETIVFNGKSYAYINNGPSPGIHELAVLLGGEKGQVAYPTWVLMDSSYQVVLRIQGLLNKNTIETINGYIR